jgi:monoamine oxidase
VTITSGAGYPDIIGSATQNCTNQSAYIVVTTYTWHFKQKVKNASVTLTLADGTTRTQATDGEHCVAWFLVDGLNGSDVHFALDAARKPGLPTHRAATAGFPNVRFNDTHDTELLADKLLYPLRLDANTGRYAAVCPAVQCVATVAVVGAGAAGLIAARQLAATGKYVYLIEAGTAIGGRAKTTTILGAPFDHGCQWLHNDAWETEIGGVGLNIRVATEQLRDYIWWNGTFSAEMADQAVSYRSIIEDASGDNNDQTAEALVGEKMNERVEADVESDLDNLYIDARGEINGQITSALQANAEARRKQATALVDDTAVNEKMLAAIADDLKRRNVQARRQDVIKDAGSMSIQAVYTKYAPDVVPEEQQLRAAARELAITTVASTLESEERKSLAAAARERFDNEHKPVLRERIGCVAHVAMMQVSSFEESAELNEYSLTDLAIQDDDDPGASNSQKVPENGYGNLICTFGQQVLQMPNVTHYLSTAVTKIDTTGTECVKLTLTATGVGGTTMTLETGAVIVTASTAVLAAGKIEFAPAAADVIDAASFLPLGNYKKIALKFNKDVFAEWARTNAARFDEPYRTPAAYNEAFVAYVPSDDVGLPGLWKIFMNVPGSNVVVLIASGAFAKALDDLAAGDAVAVALARLRSLLDATLINNSYTGQYDVTNWSKEPWVLGAYSYTRVGGKGKRTALAEKSLGNGRVVFAGEALYLHSYGTAQAALLSGKNAATRILDNLRPY